MYEDIGNTLKFVGIMKNNSSFVEDSIKFVEMAQRRFADFLVFITSIFLFKFLQTNLLLMRLSSPQSFVPHHLLYDPQTIQPTEESTYLEYENI